MSKTRVKFGEYALLSRVPFLTYAENCLFASVSSERYGSFSSGPQSRRTMTVQGHLNIRAWYDGAWHVQEGFGASWTQYLPGRRMHSATNSKLRIIEGNMLALEYLLDWPKDFNIPKMDLTLKQDESAARLRKHQSRTWFTGLCMQSVERCIRRSLQWKRCERTITTFLIRKAPVQTLPMALLACMQK